MAIGDDLKAFSVNLGRTITNVRDLRGRVDSMSDAVENARQALEYVGKVEQQAGDFLKTIASMKFSLKVLEKAGPLKLAAKAMKITLDKLEDVTKTVRDKAHQLNQKIEDGQYIEKLKSAEDKLDEYKLNLLLTELDLMSRKNSVDATILGFDLIGAPVDPLENLSDGVVTPLNIILDEANTLYDSIEAKIDGIGGFFSNFRAGLFAPIISVAQSFGSINSSLAFLSGPMNAAYAALKPLEGVLDAAGFIYKITVGPIVDWVLDTLGITSLLNRVGDAISDILPRPDILDDVTASIDRYFAELAEFNEPGGWNVDVTALISKIVDDVFPDLGGLAPGVIRIGTDPDDTLTGRDGAADVLDPRDGDDVVDALGGDDLILASAGDDTIFGGAGTDRLVFTASVLEFTFSRPDPLGPVYFYQQGGRFGYEIAHDVEYFVFLDGSFTWQQLVDNVRGVTGTSFTGTAANEVIYATVGSGPVVIDGAGGDDRITGSEFADVLRGGTGDDQITSQRGADTVYGGEGSDTWVYADNPSSNSLTQVDLAAGTAWDGDSRDTLYSIENILIQDSRTADLFGNAADNIIIGGGSEDWIDGRAGNDSLVGGAGRDLLIGGLGADTLRGGTGTDKLVAGGPAVAGEIYDGGDGQDLLIYSSEYNNYNIRPRDSVNIAPQPATGPVRINADTGQIARLSNDGTTVLAVDQAIAIEVFIGSDLADTLRGSGPINGEDITIDGAGGNDVLWTLNAAQTRGGSGDDIIYTVGNTGWNTVDGDSGFDTLDTRQMDARWSIRLDGALGTRMSAFEVDESDTLGAGQSSAPERFTTIFSGNLRGIELLYLGGYDDEVWLNGNERLIVHGGAGNDTLVRNSSNDGSSVGVLYGEAGDDDLRLFIEGEIYGGVGDDRLYARASGQGHVVDGQAGDDYIFIGRLEGAVRGGAGYDVVAFDFNQNIASQLTVDLMAGRIATPGDINGIEGTIASVEYAIGDDGGRDALTGSNRDERLAGRGGNDTLIGNGGSDELFGGAGNDSIDGGTGNDLIHSGAGNDTVDGGAGTDTISYAHATPDNDDGSLRAGTFGGVQIDLAPVPDGYGKTAFGTDILRNVENAIGTSFADVIRGTGGNNALTGGAGNDSLYGRDGDDVLILGTGDDYAEGNGGNDTFVLDLGNATVHGGAGFDTLNLGSLTGRATIDLSLQSFSAIFQTLSPVWRDTGTTEARVFNGSALTPQDVVETQALFANSADDPLRALPDATDPVAAQFETDAVLTAQGYSVSFTGIERIVGGASRDRFIGTAAGDVIITGAGRDTIEAGAGDDEVRGDAGRDWADLGAGNDIYHDNDETGLEGSDTVFGGAGRDTIEGGRGDDEYHGDADNDLIRGGGGADLIFGGTGFDTIDSGTSADTVHGGDGRDHVLLGTGADLFIDNAQGGDLGRDTVFGGIDNDTIQGGNGDDEFHGEDGNDLIFGRLGNDLITGGIGADALYGDDGNDTVDAGDSTDRVYLGAGNDLFIDNAQGGAAGRDTVFGGLGDDTIQGGNGDDEFHGMDGNDLIFGRLGNDRIYGGTGFDAIDAGDGNDSVWGGDGRDRVILGNGNDVFFDTAQGGPNGADTVLAGAGDDRIEGGAGDDLFYGNQGNDRIYGRLGNDTLGGGLGNDTLGGGDGADAFVFYPGDGADIVLDFSVLQDTLRLDDALWSGNRSAAQVVAEFGSVTAGGFALAFASGTSITLQGLNSGNGVAGAIEIF